MTEANETASEADLERLAARLAMLTSEEGEADNAGRAVGAMARRIGLTGGDLKRMFLAGAADGPGGGVRDSLQQELSALHHSVTLLDAELRSTAAERDALRGENARLRSKIRVWGIAAVGTILALLAIGGAIWLAPSTTPELPPVADQGEGFHRAAIVRPGGALLFPQPERTGPPLLALPAGQRVQIRRLVWKALFQWAEIEAPGGRTGYVLTTEIDLS